MFALTAGVVGWLTLALAPVPPEPAPDPLEQGYLGITAQTDGLVIGGVQSGMPAERAGLRQGDVILRVGAARPASFEELAAHVRSYRPGAVIEVEVQRGSERVTAKVRLATRPADPYPRHAPPFPVPPLPDD